MQSLDAWVAGLGSDRRFVVESEGVTGEEWGIMEYRARMTRMMPMSLGETREPDVGSPYVGEAMAAKQLDYRCRLPVAISNARASNYPVRRVPPCSS